MPIAAESTNSTRQTPAPVPIIAVIATDPDLDLESLRQLTGADAVEIRADAWNRAEIPEKTQGLVNRIRESLGSRIQILFTLRLTRDGGAWANSEADERHHTWFKVAQKVGKSINWCDIEIESVGSLPLDLRENLTLFGWKILLSHHRFNGDQNPQTVFEEMKFWRPDGVKFALNCSNKEQAMEVLQFANKISEVFPFSAAFGMGKVAQATRLLGPYFGAPLTYAFSGKGAVAPGQLSLSEMQKGFSWMAGKHWSKDEMEKAFDSVNTWLSQESMNAT